MENDSIKISPSLFQHSFTYYFSNFTILQLHFVFLHKKPAQQLQSIKTQQKTITEFITMQH